MAKVHLVRVGALSNIVFKGVAVAVLGNRQLLARIAVLFGTSLLGGVALLVFRRRLTLRRRRSADEELDLDERLAEFRQTLVDGRKRVAAWAGSAEDGIDTLLPGLSPSPPNPRRSATRLRSEKPKHLEHRIRAWWMAWRG